MWYDRQVFGRSVHKVCHATDGTTGSSILVLTDEGCEQRHHQWWLMA